MLKIVKYNPDINKYNPGDVIRRGYDYLLIEAVEQHSTFNILKSRAESKLYYLCRKINSDETRFVPCSQYDRDCNTGLYGRLKNA